MTEIATTESKIMATQVGTNDMLFQPGMMQALEHFAIQMSKGKTTVPQHLQGCPADCMAVTMQAAQWRMNPFAVAQKTHLINGTLGYEAQLVNAVISSSKAIQGRFKYEWDGQTRCRAGAVLAGESVVTWGQWVDATKQTTKNSPLWKTDPAQQLAYLAVKKWARLYTPDVILGIYTPDELEAVEQRTERDIGQAQVVERKPADLPEYPEAQFSENLLKWRDLITAGKKTAGDIIAMVGSRYRLSKNQVAAIKADPDTGEIAPNGSVTNDQNKAFLEDYDNAKDAAE